MSITEQAALILENRGLNLDLLDELGIESCPARLASSHAEWIKIPYLRGERTVNHKYRAIGGEKAFVQDKDVEPIFWNMNCLTDETLKDEPLVICEGEMDAISAIQAGYPRVVSVPNGAPAQVTEKENSARYRFLDGTPGLSEAREIILATDDDEPGLCLRKDLELRLGARRCKFIRYPKTCKDLNDALRLYGIAGVKKSIETAMWTRIDGVYKMGELPPLPAAKAHDSGIAGLAQHYKLRLGDFVVVTGIPSSGKSAFVNDVACRMVHNHGWPIAFASFEQTPQRDHRRALRTWFNGKYEAYQTAQEIEDADKWIDHNFVFIVPNEDDDVTLDWLKDKMETAVLRYGVKMIVVDPFNEMDHARARDETVTEYVGWAIKQFKKFAKKYLVHFVLVAHPSKQRKDDTGKVPIPTLYDISDSAHFFNKSDVGIVIHRLDAIVTLVRIAKSRYHTEIGVPGDLSLKFEPMSAQYDQP